MTERISAATPIEQDTRAGGAPSDAVVALDEALKAVQAMWDKPKSEQNTALDLGAVVGHIERARALCAGGALSAAAGQQTAQPPMRHINGVRVELLARAGQQSQPSLVHTAAGVASVPARFTVGTPPANAPLAERSAVLYEHEDGRYAVAVSGEAAFASGDPKWHRLGPVTLPAVLHTGEVHSGQAPANAPLADGKLRRGVQSIVSFLRNREWADLLTTDPDLADLEEEVGKLAGTR